jgi:hypothetical protein
MALLFSAASAILKDYYRPTVREQLNNSHPLLEAVVQNTDDFVGEQAVLSIHTGRSSGVGAGGEDDDLPTAGSQGHTKVNIPVYLQRARIQVSVKAMEATKSDAGAFIRAMKDETTRIVDDSKFDVSRQLFGTSNGVIMQCGTTTASTTVVLAAATTAVQMRQIYSGMLVDIGTVAVPDTIAGDRSISNIDRTALTFDISGAAVTTSASHFIFRQNAGGALGGAGQLEVTGLQTIVDDTATLHGVAPGTVEDWASYVNDNSGTPRTTTDLLVETVIDEVHIASGRTPDVFWTTHGVSRNWAADKQDQQRFTAPPTQLAGGFMAPTVSTPSGTIGFMTDRFCPANTGFALSSQHLIEYVLMDWDFMDQDGNILNRVANKPSYEATLLKFHEMATDRRNAHGRLDDLSES